MIRPAEIQKKANNEVLSKVLKDQIAELPPFEQVQRELGKHFRALFK